MGSQMIDLFMEGGLSTKGDGVPRCGCGGRLVLTHVPGISVGRGHRNPDALGEKLAARLNGEHTVAWTASGLEASCEALR